MNAVKLILTVVLFTASYLWARDIEDGDAAVLNKDYSSAIKYYAIASMNGSAFAMLRLEILKEKGHGKIEEFDAAFNQVKLAADKGSEKAQTILAMAYLDGKLVSRSCDKGTRLLKYLASIGNLTAQHNLGGLYLQGNCLPINYLNAYMWRSLHAAATGSESNRSFLKLIEQRMSTNQVAEAQKLAKDCQARNFKNCD